MDNSMGPADPDKADEALAGALFMVQMGARVLPVARGTKRALLKDWTRGASNDPDEVRAWAQHHPGCNWGMVCDQIVVLDVDQHPNGPDGHKALTKIEAEHGKIETWLVHTPQNGLHYYFNRPKEGAGTLKRDDAGLELRGDAGHYVLLPGSHTPDGTYRWDPELCPGKVMRAGLPAHVRAYVAGTPMKGNGARNTGTHARECPSGQAGQLANPTREMASGQQGENARKSANNGPGQLANPSKEMASGQPPKTALATWLDNRSTLVYAGRENDAESWDAMQPWLLRLRRANRTVLLVDHAGRGGTAARGTSKREDVLDTIIHLKRPSDYEPDQGARFEVHLEKARGIYGDDAKPFEARLETTDGADHWHVKSLEDANAGRVIEASEEGLSSREIAKELGICKSTVNNIRRRHKFKVIDGSKGVATGQPSSGDGQMASQGKDGE
jgi:Bifunctional DNA primase/polymerase, N-terminal/Homeodomain-like domain